MKVFSSVSGVLPAVLLFAVSTTSLCFAKGGGAEVLGGGSGGNGGAAVAGVAGGASGGTAAAALEAAEVDVDEARRLHDAGVYLLDVRSQEEWDTRHVAGAVLIPLDQLAKRSGELPRDRRILLICRSGRRSKAAREILVQAGFKNVSSVTGGLNAWIAKGFPVVGDTR